MSSSVIYSDMLSCQRQLEECGAQVAKQQVVAAELAEALAQFCTKRAEMEDRLEQRGRTVTAIAELGQHSVSAKAYAEHMQDMAFGSGRGNLLGELESMQGQLARKSDKADKELTALQQRQAALRGQLASLQGQYDAALQLEAAQAAQQANQRRK